MICIVIFTNEHRPLLLNLLFCNWRLSTSMKKTFSQSFRVIFCMLIVWMSFFPKLNDPNLFINLSEVIIFSNVRKPVSSSSRQRSDQSVRIIKWCWPLQYCYGRSISSKTDILTFWKDSVAVLTGRLICKHYIFYLLVSFMQLYCIIYFKSTFDLFIASVCQHNQVHSVKKVCLS